MRQTFNAFADWMGDPDVPDAWSAFVRIVLSITFVFAVAMIIVLVLSLIVIGFDQVFAKPADHGSCKSGHYAGVKPRHFVCDEFYPLPQVEGQ